MREQTNDSEEINIWCKLAADDVIIFSHKKNSINGTHLCLLLSFALLQSGHQKVHAAQKNGAPPYLALVIRKTTICKHFRINQAIEKD